MPILWRYLLRNYFQIFFLCVSSFISVLLVIRLEEIARFASLGASWSSILLFALYQIPYILPIAIPVSCLIAAILLSQKMSQNHELTSLRAAGLSIKTILSPLFSAAILLGLINFAFSSEIAPRARSQSKELVLSMTTQNPLALLQKDTMIKLKRAYFDMRAFSSEGKAEDVVFIAKNSSNGRLGLMLAKELSVENQQLCGKQVTLISSLDPKVPNRFDHLVIENQAEMKTAADGLSRFWEDAQWQMHDDYLPLRLLLAKEKVERGSLLSRIGKPHVELIRRLTLGLASFTFTAIGLASGIQIGRSQTKKGVIGAIILSTAFLLIFIVSKSLKTFPLTALILYVIPHPFLLFFCFKWLRRFERGIEV